METCTMWNKMIEIMKQDIKPATGCTEPISLAFAAATAAKELGEPVQAVKAFDEKWDGRYGSRHRHAGIGYCCCCWCPGRRC